MKKLMMFITLIACIFTALIGGTNIVIADDRVKANPETVSISDLGTPTIAGTGAYYDDGMLKYASSGNTIGYNVDLSNSLVEFDIIFDYLEFPGWFSIDLRGNGFDRTGRTGGYSVVIFASGAVEVWGATGINGSISGLKTGERYRVKLGALTENSGVRLFLSINDNVIFNALDTATPIKTGTWLNICGDGGTSARLFSTKKEIIPDYYTYTNSTIGCFPTATDNGVSYDKYKNVTLESGAGTFGWWQGLQNFSFETKIKWSQFGAGANLWVSLRANEFNRNNSISSGYIIRVGQVGAIGISKVGSTLSAGGGWSFSPDKEYVFEFGAVDLDSNRTLVFVNINGLPVASLVDDQSPYQNSGYMNFNGDGDINCSLSSSNTKVVPLKTTYNETASDFTLITYFNNPVSHVDMSYVDFSSVLTDAIMVNGITVTELNQTYYAKNGLERVNIVDLKCIDNKLVIKVNKSVYKVSDNSAKSLSFNELTLKKTGENKGFVCPSGLFLKQTYYFVNN